MKKILSGLFMLSVVVLIAGTFGSTTNVDATADFSYCHNPHNWHVVTSNGNGYHPEHGDFVYAGPDPIDDSWCGANAPGTTPTDLCPNVAGNQTDSDNDLPCADDTCVAGGGTWNANTDPQTCTPPAPAPTCTDKIQNGNETGIDTGGDCGDAPIDPTEVDPSPKDVNIIATKIVCDAESYLPNWGDVTSHNMGINATTATAFVAANSEHCHLQPNWQFEWTDHASATWHPFDTVTNGSGQATTVVDLNSLPSLGDDSIWVHEVEQPNYVPFAFPGHDINDLTTPSAEMYCASDVFYHDNYDSIDLPQSAADAAPTYYCVAFNAPLDDQGTPQDECVPSSGTVISDDTNLVTDIDGSATPANTFAKIVTPTPVTIAAWLANITDAKWIWSEDPEINWTADRTATFSKTFNLTDAPTSAKIEVAADNKYAVTVNGTQVTSDQNWNNLYTDPFANDHTFDITSLLHSGSNTVVGVVTNVGESDYVQAQNPGGLIYKISWENDCSDVPPPPQLCEDDSANNFGQSLPCTYDQAPDSCDVTPSSITNGSFEDGTDPAVFLTVNAGDSSTITNWSVDSGSVDYIGSYWQSADGSNNIDLNGTVAGAISQTFTTISGQEYTVGFDLSGNPDNTVDDSNTSPTLKDVKVTAAAASQDFTYDTAVEGNTKENMKWEHKTFTFTATGTSTTLTFASQIAGAFGPALDNVTIACGDTSETTGTADLAIVKTVSDATPDVGQTITYTLTATNNGTDTASNVVVNDTLPDGLAFVSALPSGSTTFDNGTHVWTIGTLASGATESLVITVTVNSGEEGDTISNTATISSDDSTTDNNSLNNTSTADLVVNTESSGGGNGPWTLTVTINDNDENTGDEGTGTVTGPGIDCTIDSNQVTSGDCTQSYVDGTSVTLSEEPGADSSFEDSWSGAGCSGNASTCQFTMNQNQNVNAHFSTTSNGGGGTVHTFSVRHSGNGGGSVLGDSTSDAGAPAGEVLGAEDVPGLPRTDGGNVPSNLIVLAVCGMIAVFGGAYLAKSKAKI